ncbi:hypothetical protein EIP91_008358 [Steccherinum ochraceum]|uniref:DUF6534 domain-containing protein n=1 Tax=Steccherinum ochraceum TaxID=92696 RepID=A0A4R0RSF8_9APHY|nr:hypothetical protein EIP91_008358 [Steccherinum ochraceum]
MSSDSIPLSILENMDINNTLGAIYVGGIFSAIFFGVTSAQAYTYFQRNPNDKPIYRLAVAILWTIDALHVAFVAHAGYHYGVTNYANPLAMLYVTWSLIGAVVLTTTSDAIYFRAQNMAASVILVPLGVPMLTCKDVRTVSGGNIPLIILIIVASCTVSIGGYMFAARLNQVRMFTKLIEFSWILYFSLGALAFADILISIALCVLLRKQGSMAFSRTRSIVRSLMIYSINGSALTSLCAVVCLVTYATMSTNFIFEAFYFVLPKLYLNSLLATLNARESLRQTLTSTDLVSIPLSKATSSYTQGIVKRASMRHATEPVIREDKDTVLNIHVETTTDRKFDRDSVRFEPESPSSDSRRHGKFLQEKSQWSAI